MKTFEEYWESVPSLGSIEEVPVEMVVMVANSAYMAGQISAMEDDIAFLQKL